MLENIDKGMLDAFLEGELNKVIDEKFMVDEKCLEEIKRLGAVSKKRRAFYLELLKEIDEKTYEKLVLDKVEELKAKGVKLEPSEIKEKIEKFNNDKQNLEEVSEDMNFDISENICMMAGVIRLPEKIMMSKPCSTERARLNFERRVRLAFNNLDGWREDVLEYLNVCIQFEKCLKKQEFDYDAIDAIMKQYSKKYTRKK